MAEVQTRFSQDARSFYVRSIPMTGILIATHEQLLSWHTPIIQEISTQGLCAATFAGLNLLFENFYPPYASGKPHLLTFTKSLLLGLNGLIQSEVVAPHASLAENAFRVGGLALAAATVNLPALYSARKIGEYQDHLR